MQEILTPAFLLQLFSVLIAGLLGGGGAFMAIKIELAVMHQRLERIEKDYERMRSVLGEL